MIMFFDKRNRGDAAGFNSTGDHSQMFNKQMNTYDEMSYPHEQVVKE